MPCTGILTPRLQRMRAVAWRKAVGFGRQKEAECLSLSGCLKGHPGPELWKMGWTWDGQGSKGPGAYSRRWRGEERRGEERREEKRRVTGVPGAPTLPPTAVFPSVLTGDTRSLED
ncbi:unnamed protein product [Pleuronectes platessa]|uniref:Uncharacterized protein n=1 Tax=Pleuronectes platessa TaxID=8262 RepID=A0A9N7Z442_PLEPL|nr:unnamed protein product [Pleuronectes platessa]